jgi:hypothetical protein
MDRCNAPSSGTSPNEGLKPTQPQKLAGMRIDPPVSEPSEAKAILAATDAAEPAVMDRKDF